MQKSAKAAQAFQKKFADIGNKLSGIGKGLTMGLSLPILAAGAAAFKLASDYQESVNKIDVAFKDSAQSVKDWSENTLTSFGLAKGTALDMAAGYGDMATSMGLSTDEAAKMSTSLVGLAGDLASFKNIGIDEANTALTAIFTGETESLKKLGIVMTQANLDEYAATQGINKKVSAMTQAEQVQLRYNYVMAKTINAQGDFERTGGGAANQMRIFGEAMKELGASMGENLLPIITPIITKLNELIKSFGALSPAAKKTSMIIAGIVAVVGPVIWILGILAGAISSISAAFELLTGKTVLTSAALKTVAPATASAEAGVASLGFTALAVTGYFVALGLAIYGAIEWAKKWAPVLADTRAKMDPMSNIFDNYQYGLSTEATPDISDRQLKEWGMETRDMTSQQDAYAREFMGFATGGIVPGPIGAPQLAVVHGGEEVLTPAQRSAGGIMNHTGTITVKGVSNAGELIGIAEILADNISRNDRRLPNRVSLIPI